MHAKNRLIDDAIALAREIQTRAPHFQTAAERRQESELENLVEHPGAKALMVALTDQAFRSKSNKRTVGQFQFLLRMLVFPKNFRALELFQFCVFLLFGGWIPSLSVRLLMGRMRRLSAHVILPAQTAPLTRWLRRRAAEGIRMNVNFLGEALLGEEEAARRLEKYLEALAVPEIEVLSVKISTLYSQISALAREQTVAVLCERLERLYRAALESPGGAKLVYLDMEEYRDMRLTAEAFMRTLERPGLEKLTAGIALQAYLPDSFEVQREINEWAQNRVMRGGAPVRIRIVKGANLEMERVEAGLRGWPQAPFETKLETDANFKRMLHEGFAHLDAVRLGVASHNVFDLAYGVLLVAKTQAGDRVEFEMLEGMANAHRRALMEHARSLLLYAPACRNEDFIQAIGYLIRRLDEATGPENFLRHAFKMQVGDEAWMTLEDAFRDSFELPVSSAPRRSQDRVTELWEQPREEMELDDFENEPDTDFSLVANSRWAAALVRLPWEMSEAPFAHWPPASEKHAKERAVVECVDPSRPGVILARCPLADCSDVDRAMACAASSPWRKWSVDKRSEVLGRAAMEIRKARGGLIRVMMANAGKTFTEADGEVSEAVDFVELYRASARFFYEELPGLKAQGKGVVAVISPWNFPLAIPCGGVAAALAAGNAVILKPAPEALLVAAKLVECFHRAGVPTDSLRFLPCSAGGEGEPALEGEAAMAPARYLVNQKKLGAVLLTGGTETALSLLRERPEMPLFAETGGKNATIVTALSDRELAIRHVLHSAFSHSGQKCSATSLLLLEAEVYDDPGFLRMLCDAAQSLAVGSAWDLRTMVGPLIRPPTGALARALSSLEPGESWALEPRQLAPNLWTPAIKWDVTPGSFTFSTELFGPVLGVVRFEKLEDAIELVNSTGFGLTSGLESLDAREQQLWVESIRAGNLYINRPTTGAIVLRQPFGGMGKSSVGPGLKAGGPNYVAQLMSFTARPTEDSAPLNEEEVKLWLAMMFMNGGRGPFFQAMHSCERWWVEEFDGYSDHFRLLGEDNRRWYLPLKEIRVRLDERDSLFEIYARMLAAETVGSRMIVSRAPGVAEGLMRAVKTLTKEWKLELVEESDEELAAAIRAGQVDRVRYAGPDRVPAVVRLAAAETGHYVADAPVLPEGRVELLWYVREQSLSDSYHRYGNVSVHEAEETALDCVDCVDCVDWVDAAARFLKRAGISGRKGGRSRLMGGPS